MASQSPAVKHHFWILFFATPVFVGLAFVLMLVMVGGALADAKKDFKAAKDGLGGQPKSAGEMAAMTKTVGALEDDRKTLWQRSYEEQSEAGVFKWPVSSRNPAFNALAAERKSDGTMEEMKFGEKFTLRGRVTEPPVLKDAFDTAYAELDKGNERTGATGIAPTRFAGGSYLYTLRSVTDWGAIAIEPEPFWLALEDYWVQRGLLAPIAQLNADAAEFVDVTPKAAAPDADVKRNFRTRTWELDLAVEVKGAKQVLKGELRNRTARLQPLGVNKAMKVKVWFKEPKGLTDLKKANDLKAAAQFKWPTPDAVYEIRGESVPGKGALACSPQEITVNSVATIARAVQVFDEATVPVRLVNTIELNMLDHRNKATELVLPKHIEADDAANPPPTTVGDTNTPGTPGMPPGVAGAGIAGGPDEGGGRGGPGSGATAAAGRKTGNVAAVLMANKKRYLKRTDDVRRMPVGVAVVIDHDYTNDLMVAYTNSPLHFQITQTQWARYKGLLPGVGGTAPPPTSGPGVPGTPGGDGRGGSPDGGEPSMPPGVGLGVGPGVGPGGTLTNTPGALPGEASSNLCEFALFGIVSLYEKVPAKKDEEKKDAEKTDEKTDEPKTAPKPTPDPMTKPDDKKPDDEKKDPPATTQPADDKKQPAVAPTTPGK